jgi:hypothetical protein
MKSHLTWTLEEKNLRTNNKVLPLSDSLLPPTLQCYALVLVSWSCPVSGSLTGVILTSPYNVVYPQCFVARLASPIPTDCTKLIKAHWWVCRSRGTTLGGSEEDGPETSQSWRNYYCPEHAKFSRVNMNHEEIR